MGLRIADRFKQDYGHLDASVEVFGHDTGIDEDFEAMRQKDEDMAGGFLPEGYEEEDTTAVKENTHQTSGFFPAANNEEDDSDDGNDPFEVDFNFEVSNKNLRNGGSKKSIDKLIILSNKHLRAQASHIDHNNVRLYKFEHIVAEASFKSVKVK